MTFFKSSRSSVIVIAVLCAVLGQNAEAQWKWRDSSGHIQYSDVPPPASTPEKDILERPSPDKPTLNAAPTAAASSPQAAASAPATPASDPELEAKLKKMQADAAAKQKADDEKVAAAKADNCSRAKSQVQTIESGIRLVRTNEKGEREFLDDAARDAEMKRSRDIIATDCK